MFCVESFVILVMFIGIKRWCTNLFRIKYSDLKWNLSKFEWGGINKETNLKNLRDDYKNDCYFVCTQVFTRSVCQARQFKTSEKKQGPQGPKKLSSLKSLMNRNLQPIPSTFTPVTIRYGFFKNENFSTIRVRTSARDSFR